LCFIIKYNNRESIFRRQSIEYLSTSPFCSFKLISIHAPATIDNNAEIEMPVFDFELL